MPDRQGLFAFGNIAPADVVRASYTETQGITPSPALVEIFPKTVTRESATMQFQLNNRKLIFPKCKIDAGSIKIGDNAQTLSLRILDRRWRWKTGQITGTYNLKRKNEVLIGELIRTPQQLAVLCLNAMQETDFNVAALPNDPRPPIKWILENPAAALAGLCEKLGCRVSGGTRGPVTIVRKGIGSDLPNLASIISVDFGVDPPEVPDSVIFVAGNSRFEALWNLEAVGLEPDGKIRPIDNLSYVPAGGWGKESPKGFYNVTTAKEKKLAKRTVFKWYRIKNLVGNPFRLVLQSMNLGTSQGFPVLGLRSGVPVPVAVSRKMGLPLEKGLIQAILNDDGTKEQKKPEVSGVFWDGKTAFTNQPAGTSYEGEFVIDREKGIIQFANPVYSLDANKENVEAAVKLLIAFPIQHQRMFHRFAIERQLVNQPNATGPFVIEEKRAIFAIKAAYNALGEPIGITTNLQDMTQIAQRAIRDYLIELQTLNTKTVVYEGLENIALSGTIQQVGYSIDDEGIKTTGSFNNEWDLDIDTFEERRRAEKFRFGRNGAFGKGGEDEAVRDIAESENPPDPVE